MRGDLSCRRRFRVWIRTSVTVLESARESEPANGGIATANAGEAATVTLTVPMPERQHEVFLTAECSGR